MFATHHYQRGRRTMRAAGETVPGCGVFMSRSLAGAASMPLLMPVLFAGSRVDCISYLLPECASDLHTLNPRLIS